MPSSLWPLPSTPASADDLAGADFQGEVVEPHGAVAVVHGEAVAHQGEALRRRPRRLDGRRLVGARPSATSSGLQLAADHGLDQRAHVGVGHALVGDQPAGAQHGDAIGDLGDLGELVRDQDDGAAGIGDACGRCRAARRSRPAAARPSARRAPAAWDRASGTSRSRRAGARRPRARRPRASGSRVKPKLSAMSRMRGAELVALQHAPDLAQHQVLDHGHARHQAEMLVHHGDALLQRLGRACRRPGARRRSVMSPAVGLVDAEDQVAERRLAGAVLAQQALHRAGARRRG